MSLFSFLPAANISQLKSYLSKPTWYVHAVKFWKLFFINSINQILIFIS